MRKFITGVTVFIVMIVSCSMPIVPPRIVPVYAQNRVIEGIRLYNGKLFVLWSEIVPGQDYWEGSVKIPRRRRVWVDIYAAVKGHIEFLKSMSAKCIPAQPEQWEFEEFKKETD